ncbi:MAG: hypothetical protein K5661_04400 [Bacteroidales bacterium]|nr:hypothetical protein [Bacteroidales bacterium]
MKKLVCVLAALLPLVASAQGIGGILDRFNEPGKGRTVFVSKGHWSWGINGGYRSFAAAGDGVGDGYSVLSLLNIGNGYLKMYNVSPNFSYFVADDLSLGLSLDYSGYAVDTDIRLDFRNIFDLEGMFGGFEDPEDQDSLEDAAAALNVRISGRHMLRNAWGGSFKLRKYLSFFGSKTFAVFGEARLYGNYGQIESCPIDNDGIYVTGKARTSRAIAAGLKLGGGLCIKLRDNSAFTISIPLVGATYQYTIQHKNNTGNDAHMASFNVSRELDYLALQVGYVHYISPKKR